ncbi:cation channel family protein (macronuclear) [Tetrahymena thermophila SB210]|uniref:Cation channel family protein n=1 Tax=Tetrahymena thermophila (strain SB210) TaxID=312017 RepID=Q22YT3_TETTS|nr:cation channel family protein [Tetrahymena thermophila SB210]EAR90588.2 cation channel family protein [Tetrahymena thermophila SB210]|eukprot:XP_001010833.2 cation channel family protein [Tetrahymena thermophila SB210]
MVRQQKIEANYTVRFQVPTKIEDDKPPLEIHQPHSYANNNLQIVQNKHNSNITTESKEHYPKENPLNFVESDDAVNKQNNSGGSNKDDSESKVDDTSTIDRLKYLFSQRQSEVDQLFQEVTDKSLGLFDKKSKFRQKIFNFYHSLIMRLLLIAATIAEIVAYLMFDYSFRNTGANMYDLKINEVSDFIQFICNSFFSLEILLGIIALGLVQGKSALLRQLWNIVLILILFSGWISRFSVTTTVFSIIKFLRILTFFRLFPELTKKVNAFFSSFQHLGKTFFPLICVILLYAVVGMSFFQGHVESRCRLTEHPEHNSDIWEVDESNQYPCGVLECPKNTFCGNPADFGLPFNKTEAKHETLLFGYNLFNSIEWALFAVYNFLMVTGWVQTTYMYWRAQDKAVSAIYFVSLVLFLSQIISNIILATLYEGFIDETSIKNDKIQKKKVGKQFSGSDKDSNLNYIHQDSGQQFQKKNAVINFESEENAHNLSDLKIKKEIINNAQNIMVNDINSDKQDNFHVGLSNSKNPSNYKQNKQLSLIYQGEHNKSDGSLNKKSNISVKSDRNDFKEVMAASPIIKAIFFLNLLLQIANLCLDNHWISQKAYIILNKIDFATIIILFCEIIYMIVFIGFQKFFKDVFNCVDCLVFLAHLTSYIYEGVNGYDIFNPTLQMFILIRCTKVFRIFKIFFHYELFQNMTVILKTYQQTLNSIPEYIIVFCILVILFAQIGRELFAYSQPHDDHHVLRVNFNTLQDSLLAVVLIFYNEEWHISMYNFMRFVGYQSVIYYLICMLIGWVLFVRLFIAIFISQFMKYLRINEKEYYKKKNQLDTIDMIFRRCFLSIFNLCSKKNSSQVHAIPTKLNYSLATKIENINQNDEQKANQFQCIENGITASKQFDDQYISSNPKPISNQQIEKQNATLQNENESSSESSENSEVQQEDFQTFRVKKKAPTIIGIRKSVHKPNIQIIKINGQTHVSFQQSQSAFNTNRDDFNSSRPIMESQNQVFQEKSINNGVKSITSILQDDYIQPKENKNAPPLNFQINQGFQQSDAFLSPNYSFKKNRNKNFQFENKSQEYEYPQQVKKQNQRQNSDIQLLDFNFSNQQTQSNIFQSKQSIMTPVPSQSLVHIAQEIYSSEMVFQNVSNKVMANQQQMQEKKQNQQNQNNQQNNQNNQQNNQNNQQNHQNGQKNALDQNHSTNQQQTSCEDISLNLFRTDNRFRQICSNISESSKFDFLMVLTIIVFAGILVWDSPFLNPKSIQKDIINISYKVLAGIFLFQLFIHLVQHGFLFNGPRSYLRRSLLSILDFVTTLAVLLYILNITSKSNFVFKCIAIFRVIFLLAFLSKYNKDIAFAGRLMAYCSSRMFKLIMFAMIYLLMNGIIATKLLKDSGWMCKHLYYPSSHDIISKHDCFDLGGDWIESAYNFNSIIDSLQVLFMVQASEGWLQIMLDTFDSNSSQFQISYKQQSIWAIFYIQYFFIANICILNMFVGLIVESLLELNEHESGTHSLTKQQKEWFFIKKSIRKLIPIKNEQEPKNRFRLFFFKNLVTGNSLKIFFYFFAVLNGVSFLFFKNRMDSDNMMVLKIINLVCLIILGVEILCRMISLGILRYFTISMWNNFDIAVLIIGMINIDYQFNQHITIFSNYYRIFDGISKGLQLIRLIRVFNHFLIFRKLLNSLNYALSSILGISLILIVFLYTAVLLSLNLFPYLKFQSTINEYDLNFSGFFQALFSFIRIVTLEMWYLIPFEASQKMAPNFVCRDDMYDYYDFVKYGFQSCGSVISYLFFYVFFLIFTLIILNLFVATIIESYKEAFSADESAINHYQLDDILKLWTKFDPQGKGYISYKEFWQFSSQIAIVYGVNSEEFLDIENKSQFLKSLNIPIYEDPIDKIFCYKFHDVVEKLSKISVQIKYGVNNLEPKNLKLRESLDNQCKSNTLKYEKNIKETEFTSGDMILLIVLSRKAKIWKRQYVYKQKGDTNIFHIQSLFQKIKSQKQNFIEIIKKQIEKEEQEEKEKNSNIQKQ